MTIPHSDYHIVVARACTMISKRKKILLHIETLTTAAAVLRDGPTQIT